LRHLAAPWVLDTDGRHQAADDHQAAGDSHADVETAL
jgi:hypothetical protein